MIKVFRFHYSIVFQELDALVSQQEIVEEVLECLEPRAELDAYNPGDYAVVECGEKCYIGVILARDNDQYYVKYMNMKGIMK